MERIWMKNWPKDVSATIAYRLGQKPLHEYVQDNARDFPEKMVYIVLKPEDKGQVTEAEMIAWSKEEMAS